MILQDLNLDAVDIFGAGKIHPSLLVGHSSNMSDTSTPSRRSHVLEDPSAIRVARVYANSLLNAVAADQAREVLEEFASFYDDVLLPNPQFEVLFCTAVTNQDQKQGMIDRIVAPHASKSFTNFLRVLAKHERTELLPLILSLAWEEFERRNGQKRVRLKSAAPLSQEQLDRITERLRNALSSEPILMPTVDADLLGGLVIQIDDTVYDGSLKTRLRELSQRLRERYLNEIQSGRDRFSSPEGN